MKNYSVLLFVFVLIVFSSNSWAYNSLTIADPKSPWNSTQGNIDSAFISVKPQGAYMEYNVYLTLSAKGTYLSSYSDSLEAMLYFDLPEGAIVTDSWLWVGDSIMQALILDKWKASSIYESIVQRRKDPSIFYKRSATQYELRVFPLVPSDQKFKARKIKITYLLPASWSSNSVSSLLPIHIVKTSLVKPVIDLITIKDSIWKNPNVTELVTGELINHPSNYFSSIKIHPTDYNSLSYLSMSFDTPMKNGIYTQYYPESANTGYYQLVVLPSQIFNIATPKKTILLIDNDVSKTNVTVSQLLQKAKEMLHKTFLPTDSFNLICSKLITYRASNKWIPADSISIENAFNNLPVNPVATYSLLNQTLPNGIDFINKNGSDGDIMLITSSDGLASSSTSTNQLIVDFIGLMNGTYPINIVDFQNMNFSSNYIGGQLYYGNDYLYINLAKLTGGECFRLVNLSFSDLFASSFQALSGEISSYDLYAKPQSGFCYGRYQVSENVHSYLNSPLVQIGKYNGTFPLLVDYSIIHTTGVYSNNVSVLESDMILATASAKSAWYGNYISELEKSGNSNSIINNIINESISNRILSLYTAFLALEPSDTVFACQLCVDETQYTAVADMHSDSLMQISVFPNPFSGSTTIKIENVDEDVQLVVYNIMGQGVRTFETIRPSAAVSEIVWDGTNASGEKLSNGVYFLSVKTSATVKTIKIVMQGM